uniref:Chalcone-flavonone isomerase family protein n=1 Tax=Tanacetum cinerariifolium TaxID=118510 RepID=A0A6L2M0C7_TANCI|nr:chalcone isomerase [Tanacetum cinerariifolium]
MSQLCAAVLKANGCYIDAYVPAVDKFREILKDTYFPPGDSILFTSEILSKIGCDRCDGIIRMCGTRGGCKLS